MQAIEDIVSKIMGKTVQNGDCLEWTGALNTAGYGLQSVKSRARLVHRIIWEKIKYPLTKSQLLCHKCDNRKCLNIDHLFVGGVQDNSDDMVRKNRNQFGSKKPNAKLTEKKVIEIRKKYKTGRYSQYKLADEYDVSKTAIYLAINKINWRRVER